MQQQPYAALAAAKPEAMVQKRVGLGELTVGQTLKGTVLKKIKSGVVVDVGAELNAILDAGEIRDGFPIQGMPPKGHQVSVRVLNTDDGVLRVTMRSGALARPPKLRVGMGDYDVTPFVGMDPQQWLDGEVFCITRWGAFVTVRAPGASENALGLMRVKEFREGFVDEVAAGMKVRVRVIETDAEAGKVVLTMREHLSS